MVRWYHSTRDLNTRHDEYELGEKEPSSTKFHRKRSLINIKKSLYHRK